MGTVSRVVDGATDVLVEEVGEPTVLACEVGEADVEASDEVGCVVKWVVGLRLVGTIVVKHHPTEGGLSPLLANQWLGGCDVRNTVLEALPCMMRQVRAIGVKNNRAFGHTLTQCVFHLVELFVSVVAHEVNVFDGDTLGAVEGAADGHTLGYRGNGSVPFGATQLNHGPLLFGLCGVAKSSALVRLNHLGHELNLNLVR